MLRAVLLFIFASPAFADGNYWANGICGHNYVEPPVESYPTIQEAVAAFNTVWQAAGCPPIGDSVDVAAWQGGNSFADVSDPTWNNGAGYIWSFGTIDGSPIPGAGGSTFSFTSGGGQVSYPGFTASEITLVFSWGFGSVVFFWFLGQCIGAALGVIRRV